MLGAQTQLNLRSVIDTALKNNLDIQIAKNEVEAARISNTYGMAGGLPNINIGAGDDIRSDNLHQKYSDGSEALINGILGNDVNAAVSADIILFNGFKVKAGKKRLACLQEQSELELNARVQEVMAAAMIGYYDIIRQQRYLKISETMLEVSQKKLEIAREKNNVGMANGADLMQAQTDLNTAEQNVALQQMTIAQAKASLMQSINAAPDLDFVITDSIELDQALVWDTIVAQLKNNPQWLSAEQQIRINEWLVRETSAQRYPSLRFNADYSFYRADNNTGSTLLNQNYGPSAGLSLQVPIFNGTIYRTQKKLADIKVLNSKLEQENIYNRLHALAYKKFLSYQTATQQITLQQSNHELALKLLDLVMLNFQQGHATILDVKAAQSTYENAAFMLINCQYAAKVAEIELKQLVYQLSY
jgi:outer membrane protein TolC